MEFTFSSQLFSRGVFYSPISPIHFTQPNYILKTRKQSQDIAIVVDDMVPYKNMVHESGGQNESIGNEL